VNEGKFTPRAAVLWATIPKEGRARILANVFCDVLQFGDDHRLHSEEENGARRPDGLQLNIVI